MVSNLKKHSRDPQPGKNRGAGEYYYRGALKQPNGRRIKTWSKYSPSDDAGRYHKRTKVPKGKVPIAERNKPHKADYKTRGRGNAKKSRRGVGRSPKGYY